VVKLKSSLLKFYGWHNDVVNRCGISVANDQGYDPFVLIAIQSFPQSWRITRFVTRVTCVPLLEQTLLTLPEHLSSLSGFVVGIVLFDL